MPAATRLPWIDHLRTLVIVLVVNMHACVTYSHVGGWYVKEPPEPSVVEKIPFLVWQGSLQSFFMGLLFFVSGYLAHGSLRRRGPAAFARERLFRLGLPALFYMWAVHPFIVFVLNPWGVERPSAWRSYFRYLGGFRWIGESGPLWFAVALLLFCLALAAWRAARPEEPGHDALPTGAPSGTTMATFVGAVAVATFLVRLVQPVGTNLLNLQLCFFPQYIAAFVVGLRAARKGWLQSLALSPLARRIGLVAAICGPLSLLAIMAAFRDGGGFSAYFGGWHAAAFATALWEQASGVGLSLGLLALFARKLDRDGPALRWAADHSFGVYVFHSAVLVGLTMLFRPLLPPNVYLRIGVLTLTGLLVSFAVAALARKIPGLRRIV